MVQKILLNKNNSKKSSNKNQTLTVNLKGSKRVLPIDEMIETVNALDVYYSEREATNLLRLHFTVNTIATNACFNKLTEIVVNEGSDNAYCANWNMSQINEVFNGQYSFNHLPQHPKELIKNTLWSVSSSITYHCGTDIFNNQVLRTNKFKSIGKNSSTLLDENFNTLKDTMRDGSGSTVSTWLYTVYNEKVVTSHAFTLDDVMTFKESVATNLKEKNGWFGFINNAKFPMFDQDNNLINCNKVINKNNGGDYIEMYPSHDLFSFVPKYNSFRQRQEKNWNYCLTYPSSSTTLGISFIDADTKGLKIFCYDDRYRVKNGSEMIKIWCFAKHGLSKNDYINIYLNDGLIINAAQVYQVDDDYTFTLYKQGNKITDKWIDVRSLKENFFCTSEENEDEEADFKIYRYTKSSDGNYFTCKVETYDKQYLKNKGAILSGNTSFSDKIKTVEDDESHYYITPTHKVYYDNDALDLSFKRLVNGNPCEYYVRIFSRIPNWRFCSESHTEFDLYGKESDLIKRYQNTLMEHENHIGQNGFAKNAYNDDIASIVYTEDIDVSGLHDNLGRPLHEIFFTVIKNNAGYREWYGKNKMEPETTSSTVEYSHCFGKNSCAFELGLHSQTNKSHPTSLLLTNSSSQDCERGLHIEYINERTYLDEENNKKYYPLESDEIEYNAWNGYSGDVNFYGDLCCYSPDLQEEQTIQYVDFRFNTVQREMNVATYPKTYQNFEYLYYDEMLGDDMDAGGLSVEERTIRLKKYREGYRYTPHYRIEIKSVSDTLESATPIIYPLRVIKPQSSIENTACNYVLRTITPHNFSTLQQVSLYRVNKNKMYNCLITKILDYYTFECLVSDTDNNRVDELQETDIDNIRLFYRDEEEIPQYATFLTDGSCRYVWRKIMQNGMIGGNDEEVYPFTNGAIYIDKSINLFVKRQNPLISMTEFPSDIEAETIKDINTDNYYEELDIEC